MCVCVCVRACVYVCARVCVCVRLPIDQVTPTQLFACLPTPTHRNEDNDGFMIQCETCQVWYYVFVCVSVRECTRLYAGRCYSGRDRGEMRARSGGYEGEIEAKVGRLERPGQARKYTILCRGIFGLFFNNSEAGLWA